jgi:hypothetical protein
VPERGCWRNRPTSTIQHYHQLGSPQAAVVVEYGEHVSRYLHPYTLPCRLRLGPARLFPEFPSAEEPGSAALR